MATHPVDHIHSRSRSDYPRSGDAPQSSCCTFAGVATLKPPSSILLQTNLTCSCTSLRQVSTSSLILTRSGNGCPSCRQRRLLTGTCIRLKSPRSSSAGLSRWTAGTPRNGHPDTAYLRTPPFLEIPLRPDRTLTSLTRTKAGNNNEQSGGSANRYLPIRKGLWMAKHQCNASSGIIGLPQEDGPDP